MIPLKDILTAKEDAILCLDAPYKLGAKWKNEDDPSKEKPIDCSGLSKWILGRAGVLLPDGADYQYHVCTPREGSPRLLDLGFSDLRPDGWIDHVVVYVGEGRVIEARGNPCNKVILRPASKWEAQKGFLGWFRAPGMA